MVQKDYQNEEDGLCYLSYITPWLLIKERIEQMSGQQARNSNVNVHKTTKFDHSWDCCTRSSTRTRMKAVGGLLLVKTDAWF